MNIWEFFKGKSPILITKQEGKDVILLFYRKVADVEVDLAINDIIQKKIEELARKSIRNKVLKKFIEKKADEIFEKFLNSL